MHLRTDGADGPMLPAHFCYDGRVPGFCREGTHEPRHCAAGVAEC